MPSPGRRKCFYIVGGISPPAGGEFLSERSERNQRIAGDRGFWERPAAYALVFHAPLFPGAPFLRGSPPKRRQSRPARCHQEGFAKIITAVLLNGPDHLLLQDDLRLSCLTYTPGGSRRAGRFSCVGADVSSARGRPQAAPTADSKNITFCPEQKNDYNDNPDIAPAFRTAQGEIRGIKSRYNRRDCYEFPRL